MEENVLKNEINGFEIFLSSNSTCHVSDYSFEINWPL